MVDIETNPLYYASVGGILLGIATSLHYVLKGNVTGISCIIYDVAFFNMNQLPNKLIIIGGIIIASGIFFDIFGYRTFLNFAPFGEKQNISQQTSFLGFALSGIMVGFGSRLGNGCTSGHGLCGLARLSIRSFVAVGVFLLAAIGIATIKYYFTLGPFSEGFSPPIQYDHMISANLCIVFGFMFVIIGFTIQKLHTRPKQQWLVIFRDNMISLLVGIIFGTGLLVAGMVRRQNILHFLAIGRDWNPSLLFVLGCGVILNLIAFNYMIRIKRVPVFGDKLFNLNNQIIDWKLLLGAFSFGLGWGISGICPGPALALLPVFQIQIHIIWFGTFLFGMYLATKLKNFSQKQVSSQPKLTLEIEPHQNTAAIHKIANNKDTPQEKVSPIISQKIIKVEKIKQQAQIYNLDNLNIQSNIQIPKKNKNKTGKIQNNNVGIIMLDVQQINR